MIFAVHAYVGGMRPYSRSVHDMGSAHHWYRPPVIADHVFRQIKTDFETLILHLVNVGVSIDGLGGKGNTRLMIG